MFYDRTRKKWPFNTGDCLIEVTTWTGLTVYCMLVEWVAKWLRWLTLTTDVCSLLNTHKVFKIPRHLPIVSSLTRHFAIHLPIVSSLTHHFIIHLPIVSSLTRHFVIHLPIVSSLTRHFAIHLPIVSSLTRHFVIHLPIVSSLTRHTCRCFLPSFGSYG